MQTIRDFVAAIAQSTRESAMTRCGLYTAAAMLLTVPLILMTSTDSLASMFNAPMRWIPRDSESRREFNRFLELFGSHEMIVVSWEGCDIDDPRLSEIETSLNAKRDQRRQAGQPVLINRVTSGNALLRQLTDPPLRLQRESAIDRLEGVVVGRDGSTSCVLVEVTDEGAADRRQTTTMVTDAVSGVTGLSADELIIVGPPVDGIAIDNESVRSIQAYSVPSVVISFLLCWVCLRSLWLSIPVLIVGVYGQGLMLAMVGWTGSTMNAILIVLPALVFVLSVSAGVHLINYFIEERESDTPEEAPRRAIKKALSPCLLAALTTAIGLASLGVSVVQPVHDFGLLGALGLMICMGLLFLLTPMFMKLWSELPWHGTSKGRVTIVQQKWFRQFAQAVCRYGTAIRVICLTMMIILGSGLVWLRTSVDVVSLLSPDNRAIQDFRWFEERIGPLVPVEVIVHFDQQSKLGSIQRLAVVSLVQQEISKLDVLGGETSVATFLPRASFSSSLRSTARRAIIRKKLEQDRQELIDAKYLADTPSGEAWRISARVYGTPDFDHERFLVQLQTKVDVVLGKLRDGGYEGMSATCTGVTAVVHGVQQSLLNDLFKSFLIALALVAVVMMFALRSFACGLLAMIPNVFPTLMLFGWMGWSDKPVDIGSVMTASVALGIAVDGTFHFLKWFKHSLQQGLSQTEAISSSFQHCGRALVQTTLICASGLLIFSLSGFLPVRHFSLMMIWMMLAALVGDLVLLPALLTGRLGAAMTRAYRPDDATSELPPTPPAELNPT